MSERESVFLDCDCGHDDAMALLLCIHSPKIKLIGVSSVYGNQSVDKTTINAAKMLEICVAEDYVKVVRGASKPLMREEKDCAEIHGSTGLDTKNVQSHPLWNDNQKFSHRIAHPTSNYLDWMYKTIKSEYETTGKPITLAITGCHTNIALLLSVYERKILRAMIKKIVLMGGCIGSGNTGAVTEWNIQLDPEAASIVFNSKIPIVMVPLEVTHKVLVDQNVIQHLKSLNSYFGNLILDLMEFFKESYANMFEFEYPPLHDPTAIAYIIDNTIFTKAKSLRVDVETSSSLSSGQTVVDIWQTSPLEKNAIVCMDIDVKRFWDIMLAAIDKANEVSPLN